MAFYRAVAPPGHRAVVVIGIKSALRLFSTSIIQFVLPRWGIFQMIVFFLPMFCLAGASKNKPFLILKPPGKLTGSQYLPPTLRLRRASNIQYLITNTPAYAKASAGNGGRWRAMQNTSIAFLCKISSFSCGKNQEYFFTSSSSLHSCSSSVIVFLSTGCIISGAISANGNNANRLFCISG